MRMKLTLFRKCTPEITLTTEDAESPTGYKASKDRVTALGCSNAAGTHRCKSLVIGKSLCPWAFTSMAVYLPCQPKKKKRRRITTLDWFENYCVPEPRAHCDSLGLYHICKIMLILSTCPAHPKAELLVKNNVFGTHLPPNRPSLIQQQDNGIF